MQIMKQKFKLGGKTGVALAIILCSHFVSYGQRIITTVAGGVLNAGDGGPATNASMHMLAVGADAAGNQYIADVYYNTVRKVDAATGIITTVAGNGIRGFSGDNVTATSAQLDYPTGVAFDVSGNLYIADAGNYRVRKVNIATGIITTVAGKGTFGFSGDNGAATNAQLSFLQGVAIDANGNLYIADTGNNRIRKVNAATGIITTVAGDGTPGFDGDNGAATSAKLDSPEDVILDASGNLYIADLNNNRVRMVNKASGIISTVAGDGTYGFNGNNGIATSAQLSNPWSVTLDASGNLYIADGGSSRIRKVNTATGIITSVAGNGTQGFSGDNGAATSAQLRFPRSVASDAVGNLYILDYDNARIRKVNTGTGVITTVAGNGAVGFSGDNGVATNAQLNSPSSAALDASGNLYIADQGNFRVRKVNAASGIIVTVAGNGILGSSGDNGLATSARVYPRSVALDAKSNLYFSDNNGGIRKVDAITGIITTVAGNGTTGFSGDNGAATSAQLNYPQGIALDPNGNIYIADTDNHRIRKVNAETGIITTVAGEGAPGFSGDNQAATNAKLDYPYSIALDGIGNLYIADANNRRIRKVNSTTGIITTVAGNGIQGFSGDNGAATSAQLYYPQGVTVDANGNLYIAEIGENRIRKVNAGTGIITTLAGVGVPGFSGDNGVPTNAEIIAVSVTMDALGNLYIAGANRIRKITNATKEDQTITSAALSHKQDFTLFPNPSSDRVYITISESQYGKRAVVLDGLGRQLLISKELFDAMNEIDVSMLNSGIYFIKMQGSEEKIKRFLKE